VGVGVALEARFYGLKMVKCLDIVDKKRAQLNVLNFDTRFRIFSADGGTGYQGLERATAMPRVSLGYLPETAQ
jgi:hypothetical protein